MEPQNLTDYYSRRASEYEAIYRRDDPVRQAEQRAIASTIQELFHNRRVLEVACGTGFWTEKLVEVAREICAVDASAEVLAVAKAKGLPPDRVRFLQADAYALETVEGTFDSGLANFWFSHIPKARLGEFLDGLHRRLGAGAVVFMADNMLVPGIGGELVTLPGSEDTFKLRELEDGSKHQVLKNYYDAEQLRQMLGPTVADLKIYIGQCFWWVSYRVV